MKVKLFSFGLLLFLLAPFVALAQTADFGTGFVTGIGLGTQDIRLTVVSLIRVALGILGVLLLVLIMYGVIASGVGGEGAEKGRKVISGAVIGLIIIVVAYAITTWVFNSIIQATLN